MDSSPVVSEVVKTLWWLVPITLTIILLQFLWFKGWLGEAFVKLVSRLAFPKDTYHPLHNVILPTADGTTQISHIFISRYGIFIVKTKNMRGLIFGGEKHAQWTQKIFKKFFKFQNPLHQNYKQVKALEAMLTVSEDSIHPVIIFVGDNTFKTPMPANVIHGGSYIKYIKSFHRPILSANEVQIAFAELQSGRLVRSQGIPRQTV